MKAGEVLKEAANLVDGDRRDTHGDPRSQFKCTAALWSAYLGITVTASDVCNMNALQKMSRQKHGQINRDDYVDGPAYMALAGEVRDA